MGPENQGFFWSWNGNSEASAIWAQKNLDFQAHPSGVMDLPPLKSSSPCAMKKTGTLVFYVHELPFQGPKKSRFSGPTPSNGPCNGFSPIKGGLAVYLLGTTNSLPPQRGGGGELETMFHLLCESNHLFQFLLWASDVLFGCSQLRTHYFVLDFISISVHCPNCSIFWLGR